MSPQAGEREPGSTAARRCRTSTGTPLPTRPLIAPGPCRGPSMRSALCSGPPRQPRACAVLFLTLPRREASAKLSRWNASSATAPLPPRRASRADRNTGSSSSSQSGDFRPRPAGRRRRCRVLPHARRVPTATAASHRKSATAQFIANLSACLFPFPFCLFPLPFPFPYHRAACASRRAVKLALVRSSTTAMIVALPMMIHS